MNWLDAVADVGDDRDRPSEAPSLLAAGWLALALTALVETARLPVLEQHGWPVFALGAYSVAVVHLVTDLPEAVLLLPLLALVEGLERWSRRRGWMRWPSLPNAVRFALGALAVLTAYATLIRYPDFAGYPPAVIVFGALTVFVALFAIPDSPESRFRADWLRRALRAVVPIAALAGAAGCFAIDMLAYQDDYPTLHLSLLQIAHILLGVGAWRLLRLLRRAAPPLRARRALGWPASAIALLALAAAPVVANAAAGIRAYPLWAAHSTLGRTQTVFHPLVQEKGDGKTAVLDAARARALFAEHSGLPELPADFDLRKHNVLLLLSEATRFDQTSLASKGPRTTPALKAFRKRGAFSFTRAHSPSSGTFQSLAGLFGMSYPSCLGLEIWQKPWTGHFRDAQPTVAELFAAAGHETFWISHDKASSFTQTVLGFDRGFGSRDLLTAKQSRDPEADAMLADKAVAKLRELAKSPRPFFGFVFFVSPHSGYVRHYPDMPAANALDLYRQEVRYLDAQLARVLSELDALGRLQDTIVIYSSDHGEEFLDHGGRWHKSTIYGEVTHVPLLVWLPGTKGTTIKDPTATMYLFPWLLQRGTAAMQSAASRHLRREIGPMLERTSGAVVTELLGPHRMLSSLIYPTRKFNYDFNSRLHQAYRTDADPREQHELFERDHALAREAIARIAAYRGVRADRHAYALRPDKKDPREERGE